MVSVKFVITDTGLYFVPLLNVDRFLTHHLVISLSVTGGVQKGLYCFGMDPIT